MSFTEEVGAYRFRLFGPRFAASSDGRYRLPRQDGTTATVLQSPQLVIETNNVDLGSVETSLKEGLRGLSAIPKASALSCGAIVNAAVRHMPEDLAFVTTGVGDGFMFLAGMLGNDERTCVGIDELADAEGTRALRKRFDARRSDRHSFVDAEWREYLSAGTVPPVGVLLHNPGASYEDRLEALLAADPFLGGGCLIVVTDTNWGWPREAALDFAQRSRRGWRVILSEPTAGEHPTLWNGLMILQAGTKGAAPQVEIGTETGLVDPVELHRAARSDHAPLVTVLHYGNPWVGIQDYPNLEIVGLRPGETVREAFEASAGRYVVVLDPDVELTPDALSEAVRAAEGGAAMRVTPRPSQSGQDGATAPISGRGRLRMPWRIPWGIPGRRNTAGHPHTPRAQADYFPSWAQRFDDGDEPQTVTVARALTVTRDNLVALDLDLNMEDVDREVEVRFSRGLRLEGPAARCSRVPDGVVAGRAGAVLTPDGGWLVESVGTVSRAWPELALDGGGSVAVAKAPRRSLARVATVVCERRREWWTANFGHWTFEVLTRVATLLRAGVPDDVKLLVPEPVLSFQRETLVGLGIAEDRILPWDGTPTRFRTVYVPTARPTPPFLFPAGIELLRDLGSAARKSAPHERLFIPRRQLTRTTRIANEKDLLDIAMDYGFVEVVPEQLPYSEQIRRFSEAEAVVGAHGSGLANAIFMARGTGLCELAPARLHAAKVPSFWNLAACGGQRYGLCVASGRRVDPKRFRRVLRDLVRSVKPEPIGPEPARAAGLPQNE
jgi:capsular polysaccharide biosynthesis protein